MTNKRKQHIIDISSLKQFALEKFPLNSLLRDLILSEKPKLTYVEFVVKLEFWLKLLNREMGRDNETIY